jgi:primosomal protein N' (replication factor Y)
VLLAQVAVPVPLARAFTYRVPDALAARTAPGMRCLCRFHRRPVVGVVLDVTEAEPPPGVKLLAIDDLVDDVPSVPEELLRFLQRLAAYYMAPVGEVLRSALPVLEHKRAEQLKGRLPLMPEPVRPVGLRFLLVAHPTGASPGPTLLRGANASVLTHLRTVGPTPVARLCDTYPNARAAVKRLVSLGLATVEREPLPADPFFQDSVARDTPPVPTEPQRQAIERIVDALTSDTPQAFLLHGVTGSGKTEVYLRAIDACLRRDRGALVLVPEIALTPQLVGRFRARFGDGVAVVHSGLNDRARHEMWKALREGSLSVAIGARSAIFAPVPRVGLIVVDEEHDGSFKQEEGVRYHGRDMALLRAHLAGAVCVLGSATPSLESEGLTQQGKLTKLWLPGRATAASLPTVELVDLRRTGAPPSGHAMLSLPLHRAIEQALAAGEQAIVFLNRRGFAPSMQCEGCGTILECPTCSVSTTLHRTGGLRLRCHYCDREAPVPATCPACGCPRLAMLGLGTERLEEILAMVFPQARVARLDRDVAPGARSEAVIERMRRKEADILVGTQMVTKGHDLPDVTVVGVINADAALSLPDFRAAERTFQLLVQVAGRAGRAQRPGRVLVQTRIPEHPVLIHAKNHDVVSFAEAELRNRKEAGYPPYTRLALVRLDAADLDRVVQEAERLATVARTASAARQVEVLGPSPAPIERLRGRYRFRLLLRATQRPALRAVAAAVLQAREGSGGLVRVSVDIDPMHML